MSQEENAVSSKQAKKAQRDAERAAKHRDAGQKAKQKRKAEEIDGFTIDTAGDDALDIASKPAKSVKKQKTEKSKPPKDQTTTKEQSVTTKKRKREGEEAQDGADGADGAKKRFIVFIGNLPYSTTDETLDKHFAKLKPYTLRHRTDPKTKKSKGFAFVEFDNFDRMKTCLKLYHHSFFDPDNPGFGALEPQQQAFGQGRKSRNKGRKINVELTAGGGGGTEARKEKIRVKNVRLEEQRTRRIEAERKEKEKAARKAAGGSQNDEPAEKSSAQEAVATLMGDIHPSRLARM